MHNFRAGSVSCNLISHCCTYSFGLASKVLRVIHLIIVLKFNTLNRSMRAWQKLSSDKFILILKFKLEEKLSPSAGEKFMHTHNAIQVGTCMVVEKLSPSPELHYFFTFPRCHNYSAEQVYALFKTVFFPSGRHSAALLHRFFWFSSCFMLSSSFQRSFSIFASYMRSHGRRNGGGNISTFCKTSTHEIMWKLWSDLFQFLISASHIL